MFDNKLSILTFLVLMFIYLRWNNNDTTLIRGGSRTAATSKMEHFHILTTPAVYSLLIRALMKARYKSNCKKQLFYANILWIHLLIEEVFMIKVTY